MTTIFYDVLNNITLLMSAFYLIGKMSPDPITTESKRSTRILYGIFLSMISILLMQLTIEPAPGILVDLRHIPVIVAAYFVGPLPTFIVTATIVIYRFSINTNFAAYAACVFILCIAFGTSYIVKKMPVYSKRTFMTVTLYATGVHTLILAIVLWDTGVLVETLAVVLPASFISCWLTLLVSRDIRLTKQTVQSLHRRTQLDFLTGLHNFHAFTNYLTDVKQSSILQEKTVTLLMIDIDYFKKVNDTYGHEAGDDVLRQFARRLKDGVGNVGYLSRNGGEEFSVLFEHSTLQEVETLAEQLRERIETMPFIVQGHEPLPVTASFGLASFKETTSHIDDLVSHADAALYHSKQHGRNQVTRFSVEQEVASANQIS